MDTNDQRPFDYHGMPPGFALPWESRFIELPDDYKYLICEYRVGVVIRLDCFVLSEKTKSLMAVNQAFILPVRFTKGGTYSQRGFLLGAIDLSVTLTVPHLAGAHEEDFWVGLTPFRGEKIPTGVASAAMTRMLESLKGAFPGSVITVPSSLNDDEVCNDGLTRTPAPGDDEIFWKSHGLTFASWGGKGRLEV
jgi:hypothetical protein